MAKGEEDEARILLAEPYIDPRQEGLGKPNVAADSETVLEPVGLTPQNILIDAKLAWQIVVIHEDASHITKDGAVDPNVPEILEVELREAIPLKGKGHEEDGQDPVDRR